MRVVTFNVQHGRLARGGLLGWCTDTPALARFCAGLVADVLALQEVDVRVWRSAWADQASAVAGATGMAFVFGPARRIGPGGRYGNALLGRGRLEDVEHLSLPGLGRSEPRVAVLATAVVGEERLSVAATHLSTVSEEAMAQLEALAGQLRRRPLPRLLLGDLNLGPADVTAVLEASGMVVADPAAPTAPARAPRRRIDHVAVAGLDVTGVEVLPPAPVSDHRALLATVRPGQARP